MKKAIFLLGLILLNAAVYAEKNSTENADIIAQSNSNFDCTNLKIEKIAFNFCEKNIMNYRGQAIPAERAKTILDFKGFKKYSDCSITITEGGKTRTISEVIQNGERVCSQYGSRPGARCESPEENLYLIGPYCEGLNQLSETCTFEIRKPFIMPDKNNPYSAYSDSRKACRCNDKGCGNIIFSIDAPGHKKFTKKEREEKIKELVAGAKELAPGCDDIKIQDVSDVQDSVFMKVAISSTKCTIQEYLGTQIWPADCPKNFFSVQRLWQTTKGKRSVLGLICVPYQRYMGPGSTSDDKDPSADPHPINGDLTRKPNSMQEGPKLDKKLKK